jgi:hypothetical protein
MTRKIFRFCVKAKAGTEEAGRLAQVIRLAATQADRDNFRTVGGSTIEDVDYSHRIGGVVCRE